MILLFVTTIALRRHYVLLALVASSDQKAGRPWTAPLVAGETEYYAAARPAIL